jgi:hypothetical protein
MLSLNYVGLVPVLVKAMQEQEPKFGELKTEIKTEATALKARIADLESQIAELRALVLQLSVEKQR